MTSLTTANSPSSSSSPIIVSSSIATRREKYIQEKVINVEKHKKTRELLTRIENEFINNKHIDKYIFVEFLDPFARKCVHDFCELIDGIYSKSFGEGIWRRISLYKNEKDMQMDTIKYIEEAKAKADDNNNNNNNNNNDEETFMEMEEWVEHMRELIQIARDAEIEEAENGLKERIAEAAEAEANNNNKKNNDVNKKIIERHRGNKKSLGPLFINDSETGLFGRSLISLKMHGDNNSLGHHKMTVGDIVALSPYRGESINPDNLPRGIATRVKQNEIKIAFDEDVPDEYFSQTLYLNKLGNEVTWRRLNEALEKVRNYSGGVAQRVANVAFGLQSSESSKLLLRNNNKKTDNNNNKTTFVPYNKSLNGSQVKAINAALSTKDLCVIHGPPGTGKTTTVVELIHQAVKNGLKVLACAPSNIAVDNMVERLARPIRDSKTNKLITPAKIVRVGHPARVTKEVLKHCLEAHIERAEGTDIIADIRKDISGHIDSLRSNKKKSNVTKQLFDDDDDNNNKNNNSSNNHNNNKNKNKNDDVKNNNNNKKKNGKLNRNDRNTIRYEIRTLRKEIRKREEAVVKNIINEAHVVLGTTVGVAGRVLRNKDGPFDLVIIDEAAQALEAECWLAILKGRRCILAGDHCQLPPTIMSDEAAKRGLGITLMDRIVQSSSSSKKKKRRKNNKKRTKPILNVPIVMLNIQYRMHDSICKWASKAMYHGALHSHESVAQHLLTDLNRVDDIKYESYFPAGTAMALIDTAGCTGFEEMEDVERGSKANPGEAKLVIAYVERMLNCGLMEKDIAIITPYNGQVNLLRSVLLDAYPSVEVRSVDGFQGREKECIIMSLVRSNINKQVGFLADQRRINVAVTRARRHIGIICDSDTVKSDKFLYGMLKHVETMENNCDVLSAIEFENEIVNSTFSDAIEDAAMDSLVDSKANVKIDNNSNNNNNATGVIDNYNNNNQSKIRVVKKQRQSSSKSTSSSLANRKQTKEEIEQDRLKRMDELTKQLQEINKASEINEENEKLKIAQQQEQQQQQKKKKKDDELLDTNGIKSSSIEDKKKNNNDTNDDKDPLKEIRKKMAEDYQKSISLSKSKKKKKKKKKKKSSNNDNNNNNNNMKSMTKAIPDEELSEDQLLEQLIRENNVVKPRARPSFLNKNKNEPLPSYTSKKLEHKLQEKKNTRQTARAKKMKEEIAKKKAAAALKKKKKKR